MEAVGSSPARTAGQGGGIAKDNCKFINGALWQLRTGAPRDLPPNYGSWKNIQWRFCRCRDKGYDTNAIVADAQKHGMSVVIPPRKHRVVQRDYDRYLYRLRHLLENVFLKLKSWRGIVTCYVKNTSSFLVVVQIPCLYLYLKIS